MRNQTDIDLEITYTAHFKKLKFIKREEKIAMVRDQRRVRRRVTKQMHCSILDKILEQKKDNREKLVKCK